MAAFTRRDRRRKAVVKPQPTQFVYWKVRSNISHSRPRFDNVVSTETGCSLPGADKIAANYLASLTSSRIAVKGCSGSSILKVGSVR